jgi:hypothetical protein
MKRRKSTRETENMIQTALWLPRDMHEELKRGGGERGLGEEIRRRLEMSFAIEQEPPDKFTDVAVSLIRKIALRILGFGEPWSDSRQGFEIFRSAVSSLFPELLLALDVRSEVLPETLAKLQSEFGPDAKPETIGPKLAHIAVVERATELLMR